MSAACRLSSSSDTSSIAAGSTRGSSTSTRGLGGGITWAWDPALCDKLLAVVRRASDSLTLSAAAAVEGSPFERLSILKTAYFSVDAQSMDDLEAYLVSRNPQNPQYAALKKELARLRAEDEAEDQIVIAPGTFLKAGASSPEMKNIVAAIRKNGSDELKERNADVLSAYAGEELYSPELVALVKDFQKENQLSADGVVSFRVRGPERPAPKPRPFPFPFPPFLLPFPPIPLLPFPLFPRPFPLP